MKLKNEKKDSISHNLLRELKYIYLINVSDDGQPKASINEIIDLWNRVNSELN